MKQTKPIRALGLYLDHQGLWQRALVVSDGNRVDDVVSLEPSDRPLVETCELIGLASDHGSEPICDPEYLAEQAGVPVVTDLSASDIALGGRGAPLSPFYLHALAISKGVNSPVVFLELGQHASVIWVDPAIKNPTKDGAIVAFDVGPAMGPVKSLRYQRPNGQFVGGKVVDGALELFLDEPFFRRIPPKWLGDDDFSQMLSLVYELGDADAEATLCGMSATAIVLATEHFPRPTEIFVASGQGTEHDLLVRLINAGLSGPLTPAKEWGVSSETLGAQTAAYLAIRALYGLATTAPSTTGVAAAVGGGTITRSG